MARPTQTTPHLIIESNYSYYAIPLTPEIQEALPTILSTRKVNHEHGNRFTESSDKFDIKIYIAEVENGND